MMDVHQTYCCHFVIYRSQVTRLYALNFYRVLYADYTSIKLKGKKAKKPKALYPHHTHLYPELLLVSQSNGTGGICRVAPPGLSHAHHPLSKTTGLCL